MVATMHQRGNDRGQRLSCERLEPRVVLDNGPLISEFLASNQATLLDDDGDASDWIEVHNPNEAAVDLSGWYLTDEADELTKWQFPAIVIGPGEFLVVYASGKDRVDPAAPLHTNYRIAAEGEYLALVEPDGVTVAHAYAPVFPPQTPDVSYGIDPATGELQYFRSPSPGAANVADEIVESVVISEIMYHPASHLETQEFIELYNAGGQTVSLAGWRLVDGVQFEFGDVSIDSGGYLVVAANLAAFTAIYPAVPNVVGGWEGQLSNAGEAIRLVDADSVTMDQVAYADEGEWSVRERGPTHFGHQGWVWSDAHDGGGSSLELVHVALANDAGQNWLASGLAGGTPGARNSVAQSDTAPLVLEAVHSPVIPHASDAVVVTARIVDEDLPGVTVRVRYRSDGQPTFAALAMRDDGLSGDGAVGDGIYGAALPPRPDRTVVEFYMEAFDGAGHARTTPAPSQPSGEQRTNFLYQVDNSFDPNTSSTGEFPIYRLIMTEAERAELAQIGSNNNEGRSRASMNGTLVSIDENGEQLRYSVGIRNRGQGSRAARPNSYHVDIPTDRPWNGVVGFNLNTQHTHVQLLGLKLFEAAGLVAEEGRPALVRVNGTDLANSGSPTYGVYLYLEAPGTELAENHFPYDAAGNLYRVVRGASNNAPNGDLRVLAGGDYRTYYEKKTNIAEDDYSDLLRLIEVLNNTPDAEYLDEVRRVVNVDEWLAFFAVNAILATEETNLSIGVGDDYFLYRGTDDPRFVLIPHDLDSVLGQGVTVGSATSGIYRAANNPIIGRFLLHPEIAPQYHATLKRLLETTFSQSTFNALVDEHLTSFAPADRIASFKSFMNARRAFIEGLISGPLTVSSSLPLSNGYRSTTTPLAALAGTATLAATRSVFVNGHLADYEPTNGQWSIGVSAGGEAVTLLPTRSVWQYLDAGQVPSTTPGNDWRVDDPGWTKSGPAQLGYGDGDEATVVDFIDTVPGGSVQKNITTYFRRPFEVTGAADVLQLTLRLLRDDGAVIYVNGAEIRHNMPSGPINSTTLAASTVGGGDENAFFEIALDPDLLVEGTNVIAVEIHQSANSSSDISFDLELLALVGDPTAEVGLPLLPGVNRVVVEAFDGPGGSGAVFETASIDVLYDDGAMQSVAGPIATDTLWRAADGPYRVTGDLTIAAGATLTIEPGTTVFFQPGTGLTVQEGRVLAEGTPYERIRFAGAPSGGSRQWDGVLLTNSPEQSRFAYVDFEGGDGQGAAMRINRAAAILDNVTWFAVSELVLDLAHPSLTVRNSHLRGVSGNETVHLTAFAPGDELVFEGNVFGRNTSGGDVLDLAHNSLTPPTIVFRNNVFLGGLDDGIDTDGCTVLIEGNTFMDFHFGTSRQTTSNAVSTGRVTVGGQVVASQLILKNNTFIDVDHALLLKDGSFAELTNNTIVGATIGAIQFAEPDGSNVLGPGRGATIDGTIFFDVAEVFRHVQPGTLLTLDQSIVPVGQDGLVGLGAGNLAADPLLVDPAGGNVGLSAGSPAIGAGPDGSDIGAVPFERATAVGISELHYHPHDALTNVGELDIDADQFEFIELVNASATEPIDLTGVRFAAGIEFDFTGSRVERLEAGERVLVVRNEAAFQSRYGFGHSIAGTFAGGTALANGGERLRLENALGEAILDFTYGDSGEWPASADGQGNSLVVVNPAGDYISPANWRASTAVGGSPGADDPIDFVLRGDFNGNGTVEQGDLDLVLLHWGTSGDPPPQGWTRDLPEGPIDQDELDAVLLHWGQARPVAGALAKAAPSSGESSPGGRTQKPLRGFAAVLDAAFGELHSPIAAPRASSTALR
jgi:hypothetical protein